MAKIIMLMAIILIVIVMIFFCGWIWQNNIVLPIF